MKYAISDLLRLERIDYGHYAVKFHSPACFLETCLHYTGKEKNAYKFCSANSSGWSNKVIKTCPLPVWLSLTTNRISLCASSCKTVVPSLVWGPIEKTEYSANTQSPGFVWSPASAECMVRACNANTQEVGAGGSQIPLQLHSEFQASQGHIRTWRKEKEEKRESSSQVVSGSIQFHSLYKEKECPGVNVPSFQQTPIMSSVPCLSKPLWEPVGKDNTGYVQGACCRLCRLTQPQRFICCEHSMVSRLFQEGFGHSRFVFERSIENGLLQYSAVKEAWYSFPFFLKAVE